MALRILSYYTRLRQNNDSNESEIANDTITTTELGLYYWPYLQLCHIFYHPHKIHKEIRCAPRKLTLRRINTIV